MNCSSRSRVEAGAHGAVNDGASRTASLVTRPGHLGAVIRSVLRQIDIGRQRQSKQGEYEQGLS